MNRLRKTILWMIVVMVFATICIVYSVSVLGWNSGYPFWMNDYPIVYIPFLGWIISTGIMFYYMFTLATEIVADEDRR